MYQAVIFDMDGTILNTIDDLKESLNYALKVTGHRHDYTVANTKVCFGSGVKVAITRALCLEAGMEENALYAIGTSKEVLPESVHEDEINRVQEVFRAYYVNHCKIKTKPYPGILDLLKELKSKGIKVAVVSNKQNNAVEELVKDQFDGYFDFYLGEKKGIKRKPAPDMCNQCLSVLNVLREDALYVGDSEIDIQTGKNAHMDVVAVNWGFRSTSFLKENQAKMIVSNTDELLAAIVN
jgi:phosphoglycolate phosphatase